MKDKIYVWDPLVRIFHWSLLIAFITSYVTGENEIDFHPYSGYFILGLIAFRVIWGFVGSKHARFSDFVRPIPEAIAYLKNLFGQGEGGQKAGEDHFIGHNPAGGLMVIVLLISLLGTGFSGLMLYGAKGHGPFAMIQATTESVKEGSVGKKHEDHDADDQYLVSKADEQEDKHEHDGEDDEAEEFWEEIHEFFVNFTLLLIVLHVVGVVLSSRKHKENLLKAMITGYKEKL